MNKTVTKQVEYILNVIPESRNSDITLTLELWKHFYPSLLIYHPKTNEPYVKLAKLFDLPREDHIKRIRAKIQNEERRFLPTDREVLIERAKLSKEWRNYLGYYTWWGDVEWSKAMDKYWEEYKNPRLI